MALDPSGVDLPPADADRLSGWKEIASALGKGVRTAQRWEKEYQLPVHRLGRDGGEIVWASRREIDQWLRTQGTRVQRGDDDAGEGASPNEESTKPGNAAEFSPTPGKRTAPGLFRFGWRWAVLAVLLLIGAAAVSRGTLLPSRSQRAAAWRMSGGTLKVSDVDGATIFAKQFPFLQGNNYEVSVESQPGGRVVLRDLDGDGSVEAIIGATAWTSPADAGVLILNADGSERFVYRPKHEVTFGTTRYSGPWQPYHLWVLGEGSALSIYAAFISPRDYPCLLVELAPGGEVRGEYWSNGYVETVTRAPWRDRETLFVGGTHNDSRDASLSLFVEGALTGSAPAAQERYRCTTCLPGGPSAFLIFPRRALAKALPGGEGQATVSEIRVERDGMVSVLVAEGVVAGDGRLHSSVWYTLDAMLVPREALPTEGLFAEHAAALAEGRVSHAFGQEDRDALFPVRRWDGTAFVDLPRGRVAR